MITPLDIQTKSFKKKMGGYDRADVEEFFALVGEEYDKLYTENATLRDRVSALSDVVKQYRTMEDTLQETLVIAQKTGEEVKGAASSRAENIISEAKVRADEIVKKANDEAQNIIADTNRLKAEFAACKAKMLSILQSEIALLSQADFNNPETEEEN